MAEEVAGSTVATDQQLGVIQLRLQHHLRLFPNLELIAALKESLARPEALCNMDFARGLRAQGRRFLEDQMYSALRQMTGSDPTDANLAAGRYRDLCSAHVTFSAIPALLGHKGEPPIEAAVKLIREMIESDSARVSADVTDEEQRGWIAYAMDTAKQWVAADLQTLRAAVEAAASTAPLAATPPLAELPPGPPAVVGPKEPPPEGGVPESAEVVELHVYKASLEKPLGGERESGNVDVEVRLGSRRQFRKIARKQFAELMQLCKQRRITILAPKRPERFKTLLDALGIPASREGNTITINAPAKVRMIDGAYDTRANRDRIERELRRPTAMDADGLLSRRGQN